MADKPYFNDSGHPSTIDSTMIRMAADYDAGSQVYTPKVALSDTVTVNVRVANGASFDIPQFDTIAFTYKGGGSADDDRIATQVFKKNGNVVAGGTLSYTYTNSDSTNNIETIVQT